MTTAALECKPCTAAGWKGESTACAAFFTDDFDDFALSPDLSLPRSLDLQPRGAHVTLWLAEINGPACSPISSQLLPCLPR